MTVSKFCEKCGKMMWDVQPCKRFCDACIKEKAKQKAKLNYEKRKRSSKALFPPCRQRSRIKRQH